MKYTTYYEGTQIVDHTRYLKMKEFLCTAQPDNRSEEDEYISVRKVRFEADSLQRQEVSDNTPLFSLCIQDRDENAIYLEKKTKQNNLFYKACVPVTREECERILAQDISWMKEHSEPLFAEFYIHCKVNSLRKGYITEFKKELHAYQSRGYIIFTTEIKRVMKWNADFFDWNQNTIECMNCDRVMVQYKQKATVPQVVANILHMGTEQSAGELMYAL